MDSWRTCSITVDNPKPKYRHRERTTIQLIRDRILYSFRFRTALIITLNILLIQLALVHYYIIMFHGNITYDSSSDSSQLVSIKRCLCRYPHLSDIYLVAQNLEIDLIVIDPDLLELIEEHKQLDQSLMFSEALTRSRQEATHKTILHLAAINETSGGQPNLRLFLNALKRQGYSLLEYEESSKTMVPEVYEISPRTFEEGPLNGATGNQLDDVDKHYFYRKEYQGEEKVSKIYTEFVAHIFVINSTRFQQMITCKTIAPSFIVIHIVVLYNYEYDEVNKWIQPSLSLNEIDRHKLLSYNVHSVDFRLPIERDYVHLKRPIVKLNQNFSDNKSDKYLSDPIKIFQPEHGSRLSYVNNSYVHCKPSSFNISNQIVNMRSLSKYLVSLDNSKPVIGDDFRDSLLHQMSIAFSFMNTLSKAYGNFSFWITGSTLLSYHKNCDILAVPSDRLLDSDMADQATNHDDSLILTLELGLFANEIDYKVLQDLSDAELIGVSMLSNWRKPNSVISFTLHGCPDIVFNLYQYERRRDFYQDYYITQDSITRSHKLNKKNRLEGSQQPTFGHHVFKVENLDLCWTRIDRLHPFRVPCLVHDHLRRIYMI